MTEGNLQEMRRVVTGNDERGRSKVLHDGPPGVHDASMGAGLSHVDLWVWNESPAPLSGNVDDANLPYDFPGPPDGGHWRVTYGVGRAPDYDPAKDAVLVHPHASRETTEGRRWDRGCRNAYSSGLHKTETVDYAILLAGDRTLVLDDRDIEWKPGDVVIDVAAWHQWSSRTPRGGRIAFDMIAARFVDGPQGVVQGNDAVMQSPATHKLPQGVTPARRIVVADRQAGKSTLVSDAPSPDVRIDPARPGFAIQRMWVTDGTPAKIVFETLHLPEVLKPPRNGSVLNMITFPPDSSWRGKAGASEVRAFFASVGASNASTYAPDAPHPYMQKMSTLDFVVVVEGEIVLVLDTQEVALRTGDLVVQRGTNHAWSNRSEKPATLAITSHDGA